jgi:hypothetical protein
MSGMSIRHRPAVLAVVFIMLLGANLVAQPRTDVVTLANGDRITGEIKRLDRGRLEFKTDDAGTLYLEWDKLVTVVTTRHVEVVTSDGRRFLGPLVPTRHRSIEVVTADAPANLLMADVTIIRPMGSNFWHKLDGSIDVGFSYTRSSGIAQLNLNSDTIHRNPASRARLTTSLTITQTDDEADRDDRGSIEASYLKYPWRRWFITGAGRFETNESLGLELRSQAGAAVGPRLINSNRSQLALGAGMVVNHERGVDVEATQNVEGLFMFGWSYFTYDRPKTNLDVDLQYYPSISNAGRHRLQLDAGINREFWKDLIVSLNLYNTFDSRPPNAAAEKNDIGITFSIGWTY